MALHLLSPSPLLDRESPLSGNNPTPPSFSPIPNKTLHIANLLSTTDSTGTNIYLVPLWHLLEAQHGFKRLKILNNRNKIGCYAIAYYLDILSAQAAMVNLQGVPFAGCKNGLEISYATTPKIAVNTKGPRTHRQDAVSSRASVPGGFFSWTEVGPHPNRSKIPTPSKPSQVPLPRGPGMLGDKEFVPYSRLGLSGPSYVHLEDSNDISGGGDGEDLVDLGAELQPGFRNEQENELFSDVYAVKVQNGDRERLAAIRKVKEFAEIEKAMGDLKLKEEEEEQKQKEVEIAINKKIEEFQLERKKEEDMFARGVAEVAENECREEKLKGKRDKIAAAANYRDTPIAWDNLVPVEFNKGSVDDKVQLKVGSTGKRRPLTEEDWASAFES